MLVGKERTWRLGEIVWLITFLVELIERAVTMTMINLIKGTKVVVPGGTLTLGLGL